MLVKEALDKYGKTPDKLIGAMLAYQKSTLCNYLTEEDIKEFAKETKIPESRIYSIASFYSLLSMKERGKYIVMVCYDVPCYINGSVNVVNELEKILEIKMGQTTTDKLFTIEYSSCLGCCDKAPALQIGATLYGNLTPEKISSILSTYRGKKDE
ncbi:MAG: NAD(P)H-dependent oxidoreductase subunit E [Clostridiales bacterium]|nr:NAD(P)H-dependent oxidoreductase subunit E [Clostridiales bacterium]